MNRKLPDLTKLDTKSLRTLLKNARKLNETEAEQIILAHLAKTEAQAMTSDDKCPETLTEEFWEGLLLYEEWKSLENGKRMKSTRVRQMVERRGVIGTLEEWALRSSATDGYDFMAKMGRLDLTGEAQVLKYPELFSEKALANAERRLNG